MAARGCETDGTHPPNLVAGFSVGNVLHLTLSIRNDKIESLSCPLNQNESHIHRAIAGITLRIAASMNLASAH